MSVATVQASSSTWVWQKTLSGYPSAGALRICEGSGTIARSYVYCAPNVPVGATVASASLTLYLVGPSSGWGAITLYRVSSRIADSAKTYNNQPTIATMTGGTPTFTPSGTQADATPVTFDVTAQVAQWAAGGAPNFGFQVRNSGSTMLEFYSARSQHPPVLSITYTTPPDTPHNLIPNGVISVTKPVWGFGPYGDVDGDALQAVQVQVAAAATSFSTPTFDSGWVSSVTPELDSSTTAFSGFGGTAQYWRARVQDSSGSVSAWSDPASCTVTAKPTVTMSTPSAGSPYVHEATPQIVWTAPGMTSWRVDILDATTNATLATSGHLSGTVPGWGVPANIITPGGSYIAVLYVWDITRSPSPGDPNYVQVSQAFTFTPGVVAAPTGVSAAPGPDWPGQVIVQCTETTAPDYFTVYVDGIPKLAQVTPGSALVSGTTYQFVLDQVSNGAHTIQVDAVTAGVASAPSAPLAYTQHVNGIWLGDPKRKIWAMITSGSDGSVDGLSMQDNATVTQPIDGTIAQLIVRGMNGLATGGSPLTGVLSPKPANVCQSVEQRAANLMLLKGTPQNTLRLVIGPYNIPVSAWNIKVGPSVNHSSGASWRTVSFEFFQNGELPFKATL